MSGYSADRGTGFRSWQILQTRKHKRDRYNRMLVVWLRRMGTHNAIKPRSEP